MTVSSTPLKKGYQYRIYPTVEQRKQLAGLFGVNRFLWNFLIDRTEKAYQLYQEQLKLNPANPPDYPKTDGYSFCTMLPALKQEYPWMKDHSSVSLQQTALHLGNAYKNFFQGRKLSRKPGKPRFKSKRGRQSVSLMTSAFTLKDRCFTVAKMKEPLSVVWSRDLPSALSSCTLSMTPSGEYYVSFICEYTPPRTSGTKITGIDLGLTHLATLSDGSKIDNPRHYQKAQRRLKRLQQSLARKKKGSKNRTKARIRVAQCHRHISAQRIDHLHKLSRTLVNENQVIGLESLKVSNMTRNRKLAKHIHSAAWATLTRFIAYKAKESQHCRVILMHPFFPSSHICAVTGKKLDRKLELRERTWDCLHCGQTHDRDVNAAQVIATEALHQVEWHGILRDPNAGYIYTADLASNR
jgi:putative transposase